MQCAPFLGFRSLKVLLSKAFRVYTVPLECVKVFGVIILIVSELIGYAAHTFAVEIQISLSVVKICG